MTCFERVSRDGQRVSVERPVAEEHPVAVEINGLGYAVMMATPADLEDFAYGFVNSERLIERATDVVDVSVHPHAPGSLLRLTLIADQVALVADRVRHRVAESSCGLCGIENLEAALRPLPRLKPSHSVSESSIFRALAALETRQPLNAATGSVHAAALCASDGTVLLVREDVGRHNAFDKLIGAMLRGGLGWEGGFALLSSRCSYELVEKAVLSGCPALVTISAPTSLALQRARAANLRLIVLARPDALLVAGA
jgi:FdhD protein